MVSDVALVAVLYGLRQVSASDHLCLFVGMCLFKEVSTFSECWWPCSTACAR